MRDICIIVEGYDCRTLDNANAVVAHNIAVQLAKRGCSVTFITSCKDVETYTVKKIECEIGTIYSVPCKDNNDWKEKAVAYFNEEFWTDKKNVKLLCFSNPIQFALFSVNITKRYNLTMYQYYLDPHSMSEEVGRKFLYFPIRYARDITIHRHSEKIYVTNELYEYKKYKLFFKMFFNKIVKLGLPLPEIDRNYVSKANQKNTTTISYFGRFYKNIRNPIKALKLLDMLPPNYVVNIYGQTYEEFCKEIESDIKLKNINFKGYIPRKMTEQELHNSDFLINFGNNVTNQLPSKILEYIAISKPIVNFYSIKNDTSMLLLNNYPFAKNIDENCLTKDSFSELIEFFEKHKSCVDIEFDPYENYSSITLETICDKIINDMFGC